MDYQWEESYARVIKEGGHMLFFERLFVAQSIHTLVIVSPWVGLLGKDYFSYSMENIARFINANHIPTYVITRDPEHEPTNKSAIEILMSCPTVNMYYNDSLHAKVYVCRCEPFGFALLSSANFSNSASRTIEIGLMIEGKGYGQMVVEELENVGKEDIPGMSSTKLAKYSKRFFDRI